MRACIEAYQDGVKQFMKEHPEQVPGWAQEIHPWDVIALGRYIIWGWPLGEAGGDLQRGGIQPDPAVYRGSNEMLIAPSRTAMNAPIAVIDPHLSWYDEFASTVRIYAGATRVGDPSGCAATEPGAQPVLLVAMTTADRTRRLFRRGIESREPATIPI